GRILMVSPEDSWPYDRTRLSKAVMADPENESRKTLRDDDFYKMIGVERIVAAAKALDPQQRKVELDNGDTFNYDKLLIATGSQPRTLDIQGAGLKGVFTLRRPEDAEAINASAAEARQAVVVGASFIGLECASGLREQGLKVDVIEKLSTPFEKALGRQLGKRLQNLHEENGVTFHLNASVKAFHGQNRIQTVELQNGKTLEAQIVILGLGVQPCTNFIKNLDLNDDGGINVNADMSVPGTDKTLFAAGDIAAFPWPPDAGNAMRFEHWRTAMQTGQRAGRGMMDIKSLEPVIPFFWTRQHKFTLRYVGHATSTEKTSIDGEIDSKDFRLNYFQDNALRAVAASRNDQEMIVIHEAFRRGEFPDYAAMQSSEFSWI
ncbi:MAG: NAD(P)/FAD-dependent oxidoreductase, partial [Candidatus Sumerlaeota bacterium]